MAPTGLHLRSETRLLERRSFCDFTAQLLLPRWPSLVSPNSTRALVDTGYVINVERNRIFDDEEFEVGGATLVPDGSWAEAPNDYIIVGLKELQGNDCRIFQSSQGFHGLHLCIGKLLLVLSSLLISSSPPCTYPIWSLLHKAGKPCQISISLRSRRRNVVWRWVFGWSLRKTYCCIRILCGACNFLAGLVSPCCSSWQWHPSTHYIKLPLRVGLGKLCEDCSSPRSPFITLLNLPTSS